MLSGSTGGNCAGLVSTQGDNVADDATCFVSNVGLGDQASVNPLLGALSWNGGYTLTLPLQAGSPAIDAVVHNAAALCPATATPLHGGADAGHADARHADLAGDHGPAAIKSAAGPPLR